MRRQVKHGFGGGGPNARTAFSLVELMIAMIILFFGLLVIGAALPVGMDYSRKTAEASIGQDAAKYALSVIEGRIRTSNAVLMDNLFRPRGDQGSPTEFELDSAFIPTFKVRPFVARNIDASPDTSDVGAYASDRTERIIAMWFTDSPNPIWLSEYNINSMNPILPAVPSVLRVYPPITPDSRIRIQDFFDDPFARQEIAAPGGNTRQGSESEKARDNRLVSWTAFYRRASYTDNDPLLYEVIVVAVKRPSTRHRFAQQELFNQPRPDRFADPEPVDLYLGSSRGGNFGSDRVAPIPWLVHFSYLPDLSDFYNDDPIGDPDRLNLSSADEPASLEFRCSLSVGKKLPAGSIFIPALNDPNNSDPAQLGGPGTRGFVPHSPDSLPIYEVTDRIRDDNANPPEYRIIVKNNGTYPWVDTGAGFDANDWPVWIIPPAVKPESGQNNSLQVFETRSPIISVARRYIRFPEVP